MHTSVLLTESDEIEREEGRKRLAPPLQPTWAIQFGHIGYCLEAYFNISGVIYQIFKFQSRARAMAPQSWGLVPPRGQKIVKNLFLIFDFFLQECQQGRLIQQKNTSAGLIS